MTELDLGAYSLDIPEEWCTDPLKHAMVPAERIGIDLEMVEHLVLDGQERYSEWMQMLHDEACKVSEDEPTSERWPPLLGDLPEQLRQLLGAKEGDRRPLSDFMCAMSLNTALVSDENISLDAPTEAPPESEQGGMLDWQKMRNGWIRVDREGKVAHPYLKTAGATHKTDMVILQGLADPGRSGRLEKSIDRILQSLAHREDADRNQDLMERLPEASLEQPGAAPPELAPVQILEDPNTRARMRSRTAHKKELMQPPRRLEDPAPKVQKRLERFIAKAQTGESQPQERQADYKLDDFMRRTPPPPDKDGEEEKPGRGSQ